MMAGVLRECGEGDFESVLSIINDAATVYEGAIPDDCWHTPYMPANELAGELAAGVRFFGWHEDGRLVGVMGLQEVGDVSLIRHAYVLRDYQGKGVGTRLLEGLIAFAKAPTVLVGTWAAALWAVGFYRKRGFEQVSTEEKDRLLGRYWRISDRQTETSVVLRLRKG